MFVSAIASSPRETIIAAGQGETNYWRDLWRYRELFFFLAWRDVLVRYKQTVLGIAWALIRPALTTIVLTVVFSKVAKLSAPGTTPYPLLVFAGMLPWQFFATALGEAGNSLIDNSNLISKVYFPRLIVPASAVVTSCMDFAITSVLMAAMMIWYGFRPDWHLAALPFFVLLALMSAFSGGVLLCTLNVRFRDFRYVVPFIIQFGLYLSPVGFSSEHIPARWRLLYSSNPMVGVIDGFRWALLRGESPLWWPGVAISTTITAMLCLFSVGYFRRAEKSFVDVI